MNFSSHTFPFVKYIPIIALFGGLFFDVLTLNRPDALFENIVIIGYLLLSATAILLLQARTNNSSENIRLLLLGVLQFSFGNLTSALLILYARSGTFTGSAIFIGILILLFLGNEVLRNRYARTQLRVIIWFILTLTYCTLVVPILLNSIGVFVFISSVVAALGIVGFFILLLSYVTSVPFDVHRRNILFSICTITILFSVLYFQNLIPPVPLALKGIGIYHSVQKVDNAYIAQYEQPHWYEFWRDTRATYTHTPNTPVFCFSSVFAPKNLETEIRHRWERYNAVSDTWETIARIPFNISGGRDGGFRGYTQTMQITNGTWRCSVETARGTLIGRTEFEVLSGNAELVQTEL